MVKKRQHETSTLQRDGLCRGGSQTLPYDKQMIPAGVGLRLSVAFDLKMAGIVFILLVMLIAIPATFAQENTLTVSPDGPYTTIEAALDAARSGDTIEVHGGIYPATLHIEKSVTVIGYDNPIIDGGGEGSLVIIRADDVTFEGFTVRNTGQQMHHEDSGIIIQGDNVVVQNNIVEDVLFGIYFAEANNGLAKNNIIRGRDLDIAMRGDGIRVWFSHDVTLEGNEIDNSRDTLIWYADGIRIIDNNFHDNRYGLHFMYSHVADIDGNIFRDNHVGTYMMYSTGLTMRNNIFSRNHGPSGYAIALKDMDEVIVEKNWLIGNRAGIYIDNSPSRYEGFNYFTNNAIAYNDIGVTIQPSVQRNIFSENVFLENIQQASTRGRGDLQGNIWTSEDNIGNYWSDYVGYDVDEDTIGDMPYRSEKLFESLTDSYPELRIFLFSPVSQAIDLASSAFPTLRPEPKLVDEAPLTRYTLPEIDSTLDFNSASYLWLATLILVGLGSLPLLWAMFNTSQRVRAMHESPQARNERISS